MKKQYTNYSKLKNAYIIALYKRSNLQYSSSMHLNTKRKKKEKQKEKKTKQCTLQNTSSTREANKYKHTSQNILSKQPNTYK